MTRGGYLIYRCYPAKVFVDGRSDFYGPAFEAEYAEVLGAQFNWEAILAAHGVDTVLLAVDSPLSSALKGSPNWQAVYDDGAAIVFRTARRRPNRFCPALRPNLTNWGADGTIRLHFASGNNRGDGRYMRGALWLSPCIG